jgi:hypothetical protein
MVLPLLAVALVCDAAPKKRKKGAADATQPLERACSVQDCFVERDVRDFEVIDQTTLIVYVGSQRCAFQVELRGTFCDLTFAPELYFHSPNDFERNDDRDIFTGSRSSRLGDLRVCSNDIGISVDGGVFTENPQSNQPPDRFGNRRSECQISSVEAVTDDELVQLYVDHGVAPPPPPMGPGQIEVGEQEDDGAEAAPSGETPATPNQGGEGGAAEADGGAAEPEATAAAATVD